MAAQQADLVVLEIPDSHWLLYTNTKHCFFFFFLPTSIPSPLYAQMQRAVSAAAASPHMSYAGGIAIDICFPNVMATPFQEL